MEMKNAAECWLDAEVARNAIDPARICDFGISVLDDALGGILSNDLIVLGADSGVGKSEIALDVSIHNAMAGRKVGLYFLEGGAEEAINRIRWKLIKQRFFSGGHRGVDLDYAKWRMNKLNNPLIKQLDRECLIEFQDKIKDNLHIYSFEQGFTIDMLLGSIGVFSKMSFDGEREENKYNVDLLVVDHLQYFTLSYAENQFTEMTQILMKVKDITNYLRIPVIMVSHLRKRDKKEGLPGQDDFFGTSNISKIASQAIVISSNNKNDDDYVNGLYPTFFRFIKSRTGLRPGVAALCKFDVKIGKYDSIYDVYKLIDDKPMSKKMERHTLPKWAYASVVRQDRKKMEEEQK